MRIRSSIFALAVGTFLLTLAPPVEAQEIPQPLLGSCCGCKSSVKIVADPRLDTLKIGARIIPTVTAIIDPLTTGLSFELSNAGGTIMAGSVPPGAFLEKKSGQKFVYKNAAARKTGGIVSVVLQERFDSAGGWLISIRAFGDLSAATLPEMTTDIVIGTSSFFDNSDWTETPNGWRKKYP